MEHANNINHAVANNIRSHIKHKGISRHALAAQAGMSYETLNRRLAGQSLSLNELDRIAIALQVKPTELLKDAA